MLSRKLLFTSLALLVVLCSAPDLGAGQHLQPVEPKPLDAPLAGMRVGSELKLSPDPDPYVAADRYSPAVAYNSVHDQYLVVWHNTWPGGNRDIYGRRVSARGELLSWFCIAHGTQERLQPAVAYNATSDEYLVVWMYEASADVYEIWGKIIPWNGAGTNSEFLIHWWPNRSSWTPRVAWNSYRNEYLVIWNAMNTESGTPGVPNDIGGHRISNTGDVQNPASPIVITTSNSPHQADLVYNLALDEYLVVWVRVYSAATTGNDIYGARVEWDGDVVDSPGEFAIAQWANNENAPAVATNQQHRYFVAWEYENTWPSTKGDIVAVRLDAQGAQVGSLLPYVVTGDDERSPDVAAAPGLKEDYFFVWQRSTTSGEQIWGRRVGLTSDTMAFEIASFTFWDCENPAVAIDVPGYLIAYEGDSPGDPSVDRHIYGRMWWPEAAYVPLALRNW